MVRETTMGGSGRGFGQTAWTLILKARDKKELGALVERYWKPCYFYIRRKGHDVEDAKDLTQGFFSDFIERDALAGQPGTLKEVAAKLDLSESNVKVIIHRARRRYRDLLKQEVARTVERKDEVEEELKELFAALS